MTEPAFNPADLASEAVDTDFEDAFDAWIGGASIALRSVQIYGDPGIYSEYEKVSRDLELARATLAELSRGSEPVVDGEESLGDTASAEVAAAQAEVSALESQMTSMAARWDASKSTWTVRGVASEEADKAMAGLVEPVEPEEPEKPVLRANATEQESKTHTLALKRWEKDVADHQAKMSDYHPAKKTYSREVNARLVSAAVVKVEYPGGRVTEAEVTAENEMVRPAVTVAQLVSLRKRLGDRQILRLLNASQLALLEEPELTAPFSQSASSADPT